MKNIVALFCTNSYVLDDVVSSPTKSGRVLTIGQGDVGQLGLSEDVMERKRPAPLKEVDGVNFVQVTCGGMHSVAVTRNGEVRDFFTSCQCTPTCIHHA